MTNRGRFAVVACVAAASILAGINPSPVSAVLTVPNRPTYPPQGTSGAFSFPQRAFDQDLTLSTAAGAALSAHCHLVCQTPQVVTTTWRDFAEGYIYTQPIKLVVRWSASALFFLAAETAGKIEAKIEYTTNAGLSWSLLDTFLDQAPPSSSVAAHDAFAMLSQNQDVTQVMVKATLTVQMTTCPSGCPNWPITYVNGSAYVYDIRLEANSCQIPTSESTSMGGWSPTLPTMHYFNQTLFPSFSFAYRDVKEEDTGGGEDFCWFENDFAPYNTKNNKLTGGRWLVSPVSQWGPDTIGWGTDAVQHYRNALRAPCRFEIPQRMVIICGDGWVPYVTTTVKAGIETSTVWSERAGVRTPEKTWP